MHDEDLNQIFTNWQTASITEAFMRLVKERIELINESLIDADVVLGSEATRARLLGQREVLEMIADLSLEDIKEHL